MSTLLNDRSHINGLVPPCWLGNSLVSGGLSSVSNMVKYMGTYVSGVGGHDGEVVVVNDLLHVLNTSEVSKHITGNNVSICDEGL